MLAAIEFELVTEQHRDAANSRANLPDNSSVLAQCLSIVSLSQGLQLPNSQLGHYSSTPGHIHQSPFLPHFLPHRIGWLSVSLNGQLRTNNTHNSLFNLYFYESLVVF